MSYSTNRRIFLKTAALVAAHSLLAKRRVQAQAENPQSKSETTPAAATAPAPAAAIDIIVIGAGLAGMTAARMLQERGRNVLVLEARNRVGGRVYTDRSLGVPLDLGSAWIHGIDDNPIYDLAGELKAKTIESDYDSVVIFDAQGKRVPEDSAEDLDKKFDRLLTKLTEMSEDAEADATLQTAVARLLDELSPEERRYTEYKLNSVLEHEYATDIADLSLADWEQDDKYEGDDVILLRGFGQLAEGLAAGLNIKLEQRVRRVNYAGKEVKVTTNQGTFSAKQAIVTLPLGVLKAGSVEFEPPLPQRKQTAIRKLGMGSLCKVFLRFPKIFWPKDDEFFGFIGERKGEWSEFVNLYAVHEQPILCAINSGTYAQQLEKLADDAIVAEAMKVLRKMFGAEIPAPDGKLITRWGQDQFCRGAYSHIPPGASADHYDALAETVGDHLFFAGEATSQPYPGTAHGAFLSGEMAARRVLAG